MIGYMSDITAKTISKVDYTDRLQKEYKDLEAQYFRAWANSDDEDCEMIAVRMRHIQREMYRHSGGDK